MTSAIKYRPDIDALRAIAVVPVVLFHLDKEMMPGGYLGVDVFFVISGYLITRLLVSELASGRFEFLAFWRRRVLRILPAVIVMVTVTYLAGQWILFAPDRHGLAVNSAAALLSGSNITHWLNYGGYWGAEANSSPLLHTWSLGVEEQFYLLYPAMLWIIWRFNKSSLKWAIVAGLLCSLLLFVLGKDRNPSATFYLLPTRAWELGAGALAAVVNWNPVGHANAAKLGAWLGLTLIICAYALASPDGVGYWTLGAVMGSTLVVGIGTDEPFRSIGLTNRAIIFVGLISYSIYLWHWPVIKLADAAAERQGMVPSKFLLASVLSVVAYASWRFIETPARRAKNLAPAVIGATIALSLVAFGLREVNATEEISRFEPTRWAGNEFNVNPMKEWPESVRHRMVGVEVADGPPTNGQYATTGIVRQYGGRKIDVLVLGDSHGLMYAPVIDQVLREMGKTVSFMTADGTPVFFDPADLTSGRGSPYFTPSQLLEFRRACQQLIRQAKPELVVIAARWSLYSASQARPLLVEIAESGARTLLIGDAPPLDIGDRNLPQYLGYLGLSDHSDVWINRVDLPEFQAGARNVREIASVCGKNCSVAETTDLFIDGGGEGRPKVHVVADWNVLYIDDDHLSVAGAQLASATIRRALAREVERGLATNYAEGFASP